jgi:hypothetical protein
MNWIKRIRSANTITVRRGTARDSQGKFLQWKLNAIVESLAAEEVKHAEIWISTNGTVSFSSAIPSQLHQRLRNIIAG